MDKLKKYTMFLESSNIEPVTVTDELLIYITDFGWASRMRDLVGTTFIPTSRARGNESPFSSDVYYHPDGCYIPVDCCITSGKKREKILIPEDDPFGEENYGYIKEQNWYDDKVVKLKDGAHLTSEDLKRFKIVFNNSSEMVKIAKILKNIGFKVFNYDWIVDTERMVDFTHFHWDTILQAFKRSVVDTTYLKPKIGIDIMKKFKQKEIDFNNDPFGEEKYGFVAEQNRTYKTFDDLIFKPHESGLKDSYHAKMKFGTDFKISVIKGPLFRCDENTYEVLIWDPKNKVVDDDTFSYQTKDEISEWMKKLQDAVKITNDIEDPFGEEDYGYKLRESDEYVEYLVTFKLNSYIQNYGWTGMKKFIGEIIIPERFEKNYYSGVIGTLDVFWYNDYYFPSECLAKVNKNDIIKRKFNFEDDPLGEEDWGYIIENSQYNYLKGYYFPYDNKEEMLNIAYLLSSMGFEVSSLEHLKFVEDEDIMSFFIWNNPMFRRSSNSDISKLQRMTFTDLSNIRNLKKKVNLKDDPFGEENYGF